MSQRPCFSSVPMCGQPFVTQGTVFIAYFFRFGEGGAEALLFGIEITCEMKIIKISFMPKYINLLTTFGNTPFRKVYNLARDSFSYV